VLRFLIFFSQDWHVYDGHGIQKDHIRAMVWAIRFGYNNDGWPNFEDVGKVVLETFAPKPVLENSRSGCERRFFS